MSMKTAYVSEEGLEKLKSELNYLKTTKRKDIAGRIATAKELGDLSENAEYSDAKEEQGLVESRILELEETLRHVELVKKPKKSTTVVIGTSVEVKTNDNTFTFEIVGSNEADPGNGKISNESPLGSALLDKKVGDTVEVKAPSGLTQYTITKIS